VRIEHDKTGEGVWLPLEDGDKLLYPEIEGYLAGLPRLGFPVVLTPGTRGPCRPYSTPYAQHLVQKARAVAALPSHVTMDACRHGGMTELGDAEVTEQGIMSLSGHRTPDAARGYVKRTEKQRLAAARKRRSWLEGS
jgi:integrase